MKNIIFTFVSISILGALLVAGCGSTISSSGGGGGTPVPTPLIPDIYVSTTGSDEGGDGSEDNPYRTIQKGLNETAADKKVVGVKNGTYEVSTITWPITTEGVVLLGESRAGVVIVDNNSSSATLRIYDLLPASQTITIEGVTFTGAERAGVGAGGSVFSNFSNGNGVDLNVRNTLFISNEANEGAAIYFGGNGSGSLFIENCSFIDNHSEAAANKGGAVRIANVNQTGLVRNSTFECNSIEGPSNYSYGGAINGTDMMISGCTFNKNHAHNGSTTMGDGGAVFSYGNVTIESSTFSGNTAEGDAGALFVWDGMLLDASGCIFISNSAEVNGGAVRSGNGEMKMSGCLFQGNITGGNGGGIYSSSNDIGEASVTRSTFSGNVAGTGGGAYFTQADVTTCEFSGNLSTNNAAGVYISGGGSFVNCLFFNNIAAASMGALFHYGLTLEVFNCDFVSNEASSSPGIFLGNGTARHSNIINCIVWGNIGSGAQIAVTGGGPYTVAYSDVMNGISGTGNVNIYPEFSDFPPASCGNLRLTASTSFEITAGGTTEGAPLNDYDGAARTPPYSMGAFEQ